MKKNKGFTLIELLAVIVILAILMVVAVPKILDVIESSRNSAANSSIKLIKDGIKTNVAAAELTTNPFTKTDGCYLFDFDTPNENVDNLDIDNKEKAGGSIKLCDGKFSDDTLTFDGSSAEKEVITTTENIDVLASNFTYDATCSYACLMADQTNNLTSQTSYANNVSVTVYNTKIIVKKGEKYKINSRVGFQHNYTNSEKLGDVYIGISNTNERTNDDYIDYKNYEITSTSEDIKDLEFNITTPGEYYFKIYLAHSSYDSNTIIANLYNLSIEKTTQK